MVSGDENGEWKTAALEAVQSWCCERTSLDTATSWAVPSMEVKKMEQVLKTTGIEKTELAKMIAELIKHDPVVRGAVMQVAYNTPGIMVEY